MPTIAVVDGIRVVIYFNDHDPPHFHAFINDLRFRFEIAGARSMDGRGTSASERRLAAWAVENRAALEEAWADARAGRTPRRIG